ncbi:hypothetical protein [Bacillus coahuilensis]|uniref:hypothetical protein n=1 Tax=Bacillus coahuilensis TaxID=408580 RepID=UPI000AB75935|nr:hypothetical protein [Bacillus coahuilensis]
MQELRKKLLSTCLHGDAFELSHWIEHVKELDLHPVELFEDIIRPTMYQVGEL